MKEWPAGFRVIEGGKRGLKTQSRQTPESTSWERHIARARELSPALDQYLRQRPADRIERITLLDAIQKEFWKMADTADARAAARERNKAKLGERPDTGVYGWQNASDAQIAWDEGLCMEEANAIGEKVAATEKRAGKLERLEDHLTREAAKAHSEDDADARPER
jgi:hypothetical protein